MVLAEKKGGDNIAIIVRKERKRGDRERGREGEREGEKEREREREKGLMKGGRKIRFV